MNARGRITNKNSDSDTSYLVSADQAPFESVYSKSGENAFLFDLISFEKGQNQFWRFPWMWSPEIANCSLVL